jgi:hypothetical protein
MTRGRCVTQYRPLALAMLAVVALSIAVPGCARADDEQPFAGSYVSVGGGVDEVTDRVGRFLQSESNEGGSWGVDARLNLDGPIVDLSYGRDQSSLQDLTLTRQQADAGLGYLFHVGQFSSWYLEAVYARLQFHSDSQSLCGGDCSTETHNGVGVKGGFIFPIGDQWYSTISAGYISMAMHDGFDGLGESLVNATIGYRLNSSFSVGVRAEFLAYIDRGNEGLEEDFASWRAFVSYHF